MLKTFLLAAALSVFAVAFGKPQDDTTHHKVMHTEHQIHHAAMHGENWVNHHVSAPHYNHKRHNTVKHALKHASHWLDHHLNPPTHSGG